MRVAQYDGNKLMCSKCRHFPRNHSICNIILHFNTSPHQTTIHVPCTYNVMVAAPCPCRSGTNTEAELVRLWIYLGITHFPVGLRNFTDSIKSNGRSARCIVGGIV